MKNLFILAAVTTAFVGGSAPLGAQVTEVSRTPIADAAQITFGYLCDDRFVVRNDGTKPIDLEYGVEKGNEHTKLALNARESVELASASKAPLELWMDGKLIAKAYKEKRSCKDVRGNSAVTVTPLEVKGDQPRSDRYAYGPPYPFYDPWAFGFYGGFGYRPYYGAVFTYPVIIGGRGGRRH
jgi:hypothetical protein